MRSASPFSTAAANGSTRRIAAVHTVSSRPQNARKDSAGSGWTWTVRSAAESSRKRGWRRRRSTSWKRSTGCAAIPPPIGLSEGRDDDDELLARPVRPRGGPVSGHRLAEETAPSVVHHAGAGLERETRH